MTALQNCPNCGTPLSPDAPSGLCPRCVMGLGFAAGAPRDEAGPTIPLAAGDGPAASRMRSVGWMGAFTPPSPAELAPHFPQLEILALIGQGGMGAVYQARQRGLDRKVALKILPPQAASDPEFAERFHREARALARLSHPHIVTVHDSGRSGDYFYLIMEFVDGVNLRQAMRAGALTAREALDIIPQICEALQFAHDEGVVHRDIKPENVLLDRKGRVKVADFGLAKMLGAEEVDVSLTGSHQVMGTPRYMAPEQLEGSRHVDHRADIYSLGVVFYELLTGELPLGRFPPPSRRANVHSRIDDIVFRTLEREPQQRYQQASQLKTDVESLGRDAERAEPVAANGGREQSRQPERGAGRSSDRGSARDTGGWGADSASRTLHGHEYRSPQEMWGWPLLHVAFGMDPVTGQRRKARGIVAIGEDAVGGLAIGGIARGGIAIGGIALGGVSIGGISAGLIAGFGGIAAGLFAFGGIAVAAQPRGGINIGLPFVDVVTRGRSLQSIAIIPSLMELVILGAVGVGIWMLIRASRASRSNTSPSGAYGNTPGMPPVVQPVGQVPYVSPPASSRGGGLGWLFALILLVPCVCGGTGLLIAGLFWTRATVVPVHSPVVVSRINLQPWDWSGGKPRVNDHIRASLGFAGPQNQLVNRAAEETFALYLELERNHRRDSTNVAGHRIAEIDPLPEADLEQLENRFWTTVDGSLNPNQRARARALLPMYTIQGHTSSRGIQSGDGHGLFAWGKFGARIEMWQIGSWYHWNISSPLRRLSDGASVAASESSMSATELPEELRRFWPGPTESASLDSSPIGPSPPTIPSPSPPPAPTPPPVPLVPTPDSRPAAPPASLPGTTKHTKHMKESRDPEVWSGTRTARLVSPRFVCFECFVVTPATAAIL